MADFSVLWRGDLQLGITAGVATVSGAAETQQRLVRRLLTNPGAVIWSLNYGAGLGSFIGKPVNIGALQSLIRDQCALEPAVASVTSVTVNTNGIGLVNATVVYVDQSGSPQTLLVPPNY